MLNKEEKEILFTYELNKPISIGRYISDFIFKNPCNFNISAPIMALSKDTTTKVSEHYNLDNIETNIINFIKNNEMPYAFTVFNYNFTSLLILIANNLQNSWRYDSQRYSVFDIYMTILQKNNEDIVISLKSQFKNYLIFDTNYTNYIFVVDDLNYPLFINDLMIVNNNKPFNEFSVNESFNFNGLRIPYPQLIEDDSDPQSETPVERYKKKFESCLAMVMTDARFRNNRSRVIGEASICSYMKMVMAIDEIEAEDAKYLIVKNVNDSSQPIDKLSDNDQKFLMRESFIFKSRTSEE